MPFFRPSVSQIRKRRISDFEYELGSQSARLGGTVERALATSGSGAAHGLHGHLDAVARDAFPGTADDVRLKQWASFYGVYQLEAVRAAGTGLFSTSGILDTLLPEGTLVVRDDGREYVVTEDTTILAANLVTAAPLRAKIAGEGGNLAAGSTLSLQAPIAGLQSGAVVGEEIANGLDEESSPALRTRLLARISTPPKGGGPGDYVAWAKLTPGVTRAWEYRWAPKVGYVTVLFMRDLDDGDPFPDAGEVAEVAAKLAEFAPIVAPAPIVQAPTKLPITLDIALTIESGFDLATVRSAIYASIRDMLAVRFSPMAIDGVLYRSWITEAISSTPGEYNSTLITPAIDIPVLAFELPVLEDGAITWS